MTALLRAGLAAAALALLAGCSFPSRTVPPGTILGGERVAVAIAMPDEANFVRMGLTRFGNTDYKVPAADWGLRDVAAEAAVDFVRERHPTMSVVEVRSDFPRDDFFELLEGFGYGSDPSTVLPRDVAGGLADFVRTTTADIVLVVAADYDRLPSSNETMPGVRVDGFGIFTVWTPRERPWITPFAATHVMVVKKPELLRLAGRDVTVCHIPGCQDRDPGDRWEQFADRYESWEVVQRPEKRMLVKDDVREAVGQAVRKALVAVAF